MHKAMQNAYPQSVEASSLQLALNREAEMSTFLNEGIAVPHAVVPELDKVCWAIGIPKQGISDTDTGAHIYAVMFALYPPEQSAEYLTYLAKAAALFRDWRNLEQLSSVQSPEEFLIWLKQSDLSGGAK
ncbi:MAG: PTS sugar transporter subunit IIA [bacterium]|nr:PTS sugar transporter subunit IIA [bacterium]